MSKSSRSMVPFNTQRKRFSRRERGGREQRAESGQIVSGDAAAIPRRILVELVTCEESLPLPPRTTPVKRHRWGISHLKRAQVLRMESLLWL